MRSKYLHFSEEGPQFANLLAKCEGVLMPVDAQIIRQTCAMMCAFV